MMHETLADLMGDIGRAARAAASVLAQANSAPQQILKLLQ